MKFKIETEEDRIKKYMKISPKKKMEWLRDMHEFIVKASSKRMKKLRWKLRGIDIP